MIRRRPRLGRGTAATLAIAVGFVWLTAGGWSTDAAAKSGTPPGTQLGTQMGTPLGTPPDLFGYAEAEQADIAPFRQWLSALERHLRLDVAEADCSAEHFNGCHLREWLTFLDSIRDLPRAQQLQQVNEYANRKTYVLDLDNYGLEDYWAVAREFLYNGGDCEDYAITKLFSLRWLGIDTDALRIVVLQDTNLRIPHAVLAVYQDGDIFILDNQIEKVVRHRDIVHYVPVYSINEAHWWIHTPSL